MYFSGICVIVQLVMPVFILPSTAVVMDLKVWKNSDFPEIIHQKRAAMSVPGSFDNNIYLDAIGVPRGVPNEHKARNQIAAGFESVFFWWATINKNVDWIKGRGETGNDAIGYNDLSLAVGGGKR